MKVSTMAPVSFEQFNSWKLCLSLEKISLVTLNQFSLNFKFYETTDTLAKITFQGFIQFFSFLEREISIYFCIQ